ncbi:MAG: IclR family transcriptional regulator [Proteobacteria bacterium]|nr:IclR family transcriptional regulator [Pseudomonadota bacterium]
MDAEVNPFTPEDGPTTTRSRMSGLLRATQVLDRLVVEGKSTSAYDLAKAIHAPVSTIYGVVDALVQAGLLERDSGGAVWFGSRMYHYGLAYGRNVDLLREARTEMRRLAHDLGETVQICARHEGFVVIQDMAEASRNLRVSSRIGARVPINWSVSGRFFLAHLPQHEQLEIFRQNAVPSATGRAPIDPAQFVALCDEARRLGYASQLSGTDEGIACIAAPITNASGICEMTISIIMPELRVRESLDTYATAVREAAARIEARVGWRPFGPMPSRKSDPVQGHDMVPPSPVFPRYEVMA